MIPADWLTKVELADAPESTNRKHILALSGGKDSTAMAIATKRYEPFEYTYVCTPTGDELPEMEAHWAKLEDILDAPIIRLGDRTLFGLIMEQEALPNHAARWCTRIIKLKQYYEWLDTQGSVISHVGLRADEESRPGMIFPDAGEIVMDFPMRRWGWGIDDVRQFLLDEGVAIPERTDCAVCFWQKLGEWWLLWRDYPERFERGVVAEEFVSAKRGHEYTFRSAQRDTWPAGLRALRERFEAGEVPKRSLAMMDKNRMSGTCRVCTL